MQTETSSSGLFTSTSASRIATERRCWLVVPAALLLVAVVFGISLSTHPALAAQPAENPIQRENALAGTTAWRLPQAPGRSIEGYASEVSVSPGSLVQLHVSTDPAASYRVEVYRVGWYGGTGGRLVACLPSCTADERGSLRPLPPIDASTGYLNAAWPVTDTLAVGPSWTSGYYLAELVLTSGPHTEEGGWIPLIVLEPPTRSAQILVEVPVNTWQAYNDWGGKSLYVNYTGVGDNHVSFDRPYDTSWLETAAGRQRGGSGNLPQVLEFPLVRFLERSGYDVSYTTDVDTDAHPAELLRHRLVITAGHGEYWTKTIRDAFEGALALGTNMAFLGANTGYWQSRYADDRRTIVEYRKAARDPEPDPELKTTRFRSLTPPRPECELFGVESADDSPGDESIGIADYAVDPAALADPWFMGTAFTPGTVFPKLVGFEWDLITPGCTTPPLTDLFHYAGKVPADGVRYTAPSGARVFSAGTLRFSWALDPSKTPGDPGATYGNPGLEQFMRNALADLLRPAPPLGVSVEHSTAHALTILVSRHADARVTAALVYRRRRLLCIARRFVCTVRRVAGPTPYTVVLRDRWGTTSLPVLAGGEITPPPTLR